MKVVGKTSTRFAVRQYPFMSWLFSGLVLAFSLSIFWPLLFGGPGALCPRRYGSGSPCSWVDGVFALIALAIAVGALLRASIDTCTFYKSLQKVVLERKRLFETQIIEYPLHTISQVAVREYPGRWGRRFYRAVLVLRSAAEVPIHQDQVSDRQIHHIVEEANRFLDNKP